jgi:hypothetical protein
VASYIGKVAKRAEAKVAKEKAELEGQTEADAVPAKQSEDEFAEAS